MPSSRDPADGRPGDPTDPGWAALGTEARHPASRDLDALPSEAVVALLLEEDRSGLAAALAHRDAIAAAAERLAATLAAGGDVVFAGAGTSGRLGVLEAAECPPTFGTDPRRVRAVVAGGDGAVFRAVEGAEDDAAAGRRAVSDLGPDDLLVAVSASAVTPYVRGALAAAREAGAGTVLLTCAAPRGLDGLAELLLALDTGPEVLTGSTRLKAGSVTKAVLNAITTAAMTRLGKVYDNLMVDLGSGSAKLRDRARRVVAAATGLPAAAAERALEAAGGEVKTAIVMARLGVDAGAARGRLAAAGGRVRAALRRRR